MSESKVSPDRKKKAGSIVSEDKILEVLTADFLNAMEKVEDVLKSSMHRVDGIERKLQTMLLNLETRERLERELEEEKKVLRRNEERLQGLRRKNTGSFMVAASLVFACFLIYGLYCMYNTR